MGKATGSSLVGALVMRIEMGRENGILAPTVRLRVKCGDHKTPLAGSWGMETAEIDVVPGLLVSWLSCNPGKASGMQKPLVSAAEDWPPGMDWRKRSFEDLGSA